MRELGTEENRREDAYEMAVTGSGDDIEDPAAGFVTLFPPTKISDASEVLAKSEIGMVPSFVASVLPSTSLCCGGKGDSCKETTSDVCPSSDSRSRWERSGSGMDEEASPEELTVTRRRGSRRTESVLISYTTRGNPVCAS